MSSQETIDGDISLKMPQFFEFKMERAISMFMGGDSHNAVAGNSNVHRRMHRTIV